MLFLQKITPLLILNLIAVLFCLQWEQEDTFWIDRFDEPLSENWKNRNKHCNSIYTLQEEADNQYLAAHSVGSACFIVKRIKVDIVKYPYLNWKWRVHHFPENGDESAKKYCDVPASLTLVLNKRKLFPKSMKYTWSTTLAQDSLTKSPYASWPARCDIHVLKTGMQASDNWVTEKVNVLEDYKRFYKKKKVKSKVVNAIVIMSDSDNTHTPSAADYDDIYFSKD